jgi:hypothetical protein
MYYNITLRRVRVNNCCRRKTVSITYYECVFVVLGIQHAMRMHHIFACDLPGSSVWNISHYKKNSARYDEKVSWFSFKVPVIIVKISHQIWIFSRFSKNIKKNNFMKIRPVGAELLHADGRTDRQQTDNRHNEANSCFSKICDSI